MFKEIYALPLALSPPDAIQLSIKTHNEQVAQVIFEKLSVVEFY